MASKLMQKRVGVTRQEAEAIIRSLEARGVDPASSRSCLPAAGMEGRIPGIAGCNCYDRCPFGSIRYGNFKGQGPKNIKVYLNPNDGSRRQQELPYTCYGYVEHLLARQRAGLAAREKGLDGEIIDVVGGEPGVVIPNADPRHMHVCRTKVMVKKSPDDRGPNAEFITRVEVKEILPFAYDEVEREDTFEAGLEMQFVEREKLEKGTLAPPELPAQPHAAEFSEDEDDALMPVDLDDLADAPLNKVEAAVPVGKKK